MDLKRKVGVAVGAVLLTGALLTGAAFASEEGKAPTAQTERVDKAVQEGKLTQGEADTLKKLGELRRSYMEKYKAEAKALLEQSVKDGKITKEQAQRILKHQQGRMQHHGKGWGKPGKALTEEQLKSKLAEAVKSGKITQEKADAILQKWQEHKAKAQQ